jgi:hypothetical protein
MLTRFCLALCGIVILTACGRSDDGVSGKAGWMKVGETDGYVYYADRAGIRKSDKTVTMSELFDYKTARTEGGSGQVLSKKTDREYDCQGQKSQALKTTWFTGRMGSGTAARSSENTDHLTAVMSGSPTAGLLKIACSNP